jgi:hypothetical protein
MKFRAVLILIAAMGCILLSGCYNNPRTSLKHPGEGPAHIMSGPATGPGTTAGGSTAGPQPQKEEHGGDHAKP